MKTTLRARLLLVAAAFSITGGMSYAQSSTPAVTSDDAKRPEFDVVSVKVNNSGSMNCRAGFPPGGDGMEVLNCPLMVILRVAYGMFNSTDDMISGIPGWAKTVHFDIQAKMSEADIARLKNVDPMHPPQYVHDQLKLMVQALLADRFKMVAHNETKILPVYDLVIAKNGSKLKEAAPGDTYANGIKGPDGVAHAGFMRNGRGKLDGQAISTEQLASWMWQEVGRTVVDKTGLTGKYDITLQWTPEDHSASVSAAQTASAEAAGPSIYTALQEQLGLKLEPAKGPVETLVIDHVEMPSAN